MEIKGTMPKEKFDEIYHQVPRICVEVVIQNEKGVLLTKRAITPWKNLWHFPGGGILYGETLEEAVKRIAKEELNLNVEMEKILGVIEFLDDAERSGQHPISLAVLVKVLEGEIKLNYQATEFNFFKEIPEDTILSHKKFIEENLL